MIEIVKNTYEKVRKLFEYNPEEKENLSRLRRLIISREWQGPSDYFVNPITNPHRETRHSNDISGILNIVKVKGVVNLATLPIQFHPADSSLDLYDIMNGLARAGFVELVRNTFVDNKRAIRQEQVSSISSMEELIKSRESGTFYAIYNPRFPKSPRKREVKYIC
ncbi:hypothetical protein J4474_03475 [Candidatus Pacearchaeota archaeon]|nr:hypothetical protein [Candidatus Pacearchaeota archaeon]